VGGVGASAAEAVRAAERIAADAATRVRRLQDLAGKREVGPTARVSLREIVDGALEVVGPELARDPAAGAPVRIVDRSSRLPAVDGDVAELAQVLVGLLLNARDAMPRGGTVTVASRVDPDGSVELAVMDEGTGIAPEHLRRIFDPFFTTKGSRRGTGLGLSIAANVMRRLGGAIEVGNRPGGGATFTLRFPPPRPEVEEATRPAEPAPAPGAAAAEQPHATRRVLVVDDDIDNLDAMRLVVEQFGHYVEVAELGGDAIERVRAGERYDLVLCDLGLGDTTGWDVAEAIHRLAPATRFYLVTGWAEEIRRDDPRRSHVLRVLPKPLDVDELKRILAEPVSGAAVRPTATARRDAASAGGAPPPA
jgi:CheY-like chemotaxis protein